MRHRFTLTLVGLLLAAFVSAQAQVSQNMTGSGPFCLKSSAGNASCIYQTMAQCEQAKPSSSSDQCLDRAQIIGRATCLQLRRIDDAHEVGELVRVGNVEGNVAAIAVLRSGATVMTSCIWK